MLLSYDMKETGTGDNGKTLGKTRYQIFEIRETDDKNFRWTNYPYLESVVEESGVTSTERNSAFWRLYGTIQIEQEKRGAPLINSQILKAILCAGQILIEGQDTKSEGQR